MNRSITRDNFFPSCPAVMNYSPFTDYRQSNRREQYIRNINGIVRDDDFRLFYQGNAEKIMNAEWKYMKQNFGCQENYCFHNLPTRPPHGAFYTEMKTYNDVKSGKQTTNLPVCKKFEDYRMTVTKH